MDRGSDSTGTRDEEPASSGGSEETAEAEGGLIRVIRYGLLPPHEGAAYVEEQMYLGHRYGNDLIEIERGRREALRQAERAVPGVAEAEAAYAEAVTAFTAAKDAFKAARAKERRRAETTEHKQRLSAATKQLSAASTSLHAARRKARRDPSVVALRAKIDGERSAERGAKGGLVGEAKRGARALSGVAWGIYSRVEARKDASRKAIDKGAPGKPGGLYDGLDSNDPLFSRWQRDGFVGAQQIARTVADEREGAKSRVRTVTGITVPELFSGQDPRVRIGEAVHIRKVGRWEGANAVYDSVVDGSAQRSRPSVNGKKPVTLSIRVGKGPAATWCSWPMRMHRPLPADATVREVVVHRRMVGDREEWYATIVVKIDSDKRVRAATGAVAVDLGWRKREDGSVRVGTWYATDGTSGEIAVSAGTVESFAKVKRLQAIRDREFDSIRETILDWWKTPIPRAVPEWLAADLLHLHKWKSKERLQRLVQRWKRERFQGDDQGFAAAEAWRYRDYHLWRDEEGSRQRALRFRKQEYRIEAKRLAALSHTVVLEEFDLRKMAARPELGADDETGDDDAARAQRQLTAPSILRNCLIHAFAEVAHVPAKNTTRMCHVCGVVHPFDAKKNIWREPACPECGAEWDQDINAAINMLSLWTNRTDKTPPPKKKKAAGSRFQRSLHEAEERRKAGEAAATEGAGDNP